MVPPSPTSTIDFDAAKLQHPGITGSRRLLLKTASLVELRQQLNLLLQTSLDVEHILSLFFREVQCLLPLHALVFLHPAHDLQLELGEQAPYSIGYRLRHSGEYLGELIFRRAQRFGDDEQAQLESLLACLLFPLRNALLYRNALLSALRDPLTDTGNRIAMDQALQREIELARRNLLPLSLLMLDIDHFKAINDSHGHAIGDKVLKAVARTLKNQLRRIDMVFRYGGEEFLVLLSNTGSESAALVGERLRHAVLAMQCLDSGQPIDVSISLGCASLLPGEPSDSLLRRADSALYVAKRNGRNRLSMAS